MIANKNSAYTLVELSMVIVIIGFLIAAVAAGVNLVKQASLRSVISDMNGYVTSFNAFSSRYGRPPGDYDMAYNIWGAKCSSYISYCNGNADGIIQRNMDAGADEVHKAWNHLSNAEMIFNTGIIPLTYGGNIYTQLVVNAPVSRIAGAGYIMWGGTFATPFSPNSNAIFLGKPTSGDTLTTGAITAVDAFSIDIKVDDGGFDTSSPPNSVGAVTGNWRTLDGATSATGACVNNTTTGSYTITNSTTACRVGLLLGIA